MVNENLASSRWNLLVLLFLKSKLKITKINKKADIHNCFIIFSNVIFVGTQLLLAFVLCFSSCSPALNLLCPFRTG